MFYFLVRRKGEYSFFEENLNFPESAFRLHQEEHAEKAHKRMLNQAVSLLLRQSPSNEKSTKQNL